MKLTDQFALNVEPTAKIEFYRDEAVRGFCLKVTPNGSKTWFLYTRIHTRLLNRSIGSIKTFTAKDARDTARQWTSELIRGIDTQGSIKERQIAERKERIEASKRGKIFQVATEYLATVPIKQSSIEYYQTLLNTGLKPYHHMVLADIDFDWVRITLDAISKKTTPLQAAKCIKFIRTLRFWKDLSSPIPSRIRMATSKPRQARLEPSDGAKIWAALKAGPKNTSWLYIRALLLTGCRTEELSTVTVGQVDLASGYFQLANTKNGRDHKVYLAKETSKVFEKMMKNKEPSDLVFDVANDGRSCKNSLQHIKTWSNHDLRKLFAIVAMEIAIPYPVIKAALNHSSGDVTLAHYAHATPSQLRACWERIAEFYTGKSKSLETFNEPQPSSGQCAYLNQVN